MAVKLGWTIFNGLAPEISEDGGKGPRVLDNLFTFAVGGATVQQLELFEESATKNMDFVQAVAWYTLAAQSFTFVAKGGANHRIVIPARTYGFMPMMVSVMPPQFELTISAAADATLQMWFMNVPFAPYVVAIP